MHTVIVQITANLFEVRVKDADGQVLGLFTEAHAAAAFMQAYSLGRY